MPANLSARAILWIGIGLVAASVLIQLIRDFAFRLVDAASLQDLANSWVFDSVAVALVLLVPLGTMLIAAFFVARLIERGQGALKQPTGRVNAGSITAAGVFWAGLALTMLGLVVGASLESWLGTLVAQGRPSIALDALTIVVSPLRNVLIPLGLALLAASALIKKIEARNRAETGSAAAAQLPR